MSSPTTPPPELPKLYFPKETEVCTQVFHTFARDCADIFHMFMFSVRLAAISDENRLRAAKALWGIKQSEEEQAKYQRMLENPDPAAKQLAEFSSLNSRNLVTGTADAFLWYLSNIIQSAIKRKPDLLKSSESIKLDDIMEFRRRSDLVEFLIDKKVTELSYGGLKKMEQYLQERLGLSPFEDNATRDILSLFMEIRNIYVHNRGFVNSVFMARVRDAHGLVPSLGKRLHVDFDWYATFQAAAVRSALNIDRAVAEKFGLKRKRLRAWSQGDRSATPKTASAEANPNGVPV